MWSFTSTLNNQNSFFIFIKYFDFLQTISSWVHIQNTVNPCKPAGRISRISNKWTKIHYTMMEHFDGVKWKEKKTFLIPSSISSKS
jgi:hypothetical protein